MLKSHSSASRVKKKRAERARSRPSHRRRRAESVASAAPAQVQVAHPTGESVDNKLEQPRLQVRDVVPRAAHAWGFVRNLDTGDDLAARAASNHAPTERDATLWWDKERSRFLVVMNDRIIDDLAPLQFVQFVRQLRHASSRILFKYERRPDGATGRAARVWAE